MSIFVSDSDLLEGEVFYIYKETDSGNKRPIPIYSEEDKKKYADEIHSFKVYFRRPNYRISNDILKKSIVTRFDGSIALDIVAMREAELKELLVKWDLKDDDTGVPIPLTPNVLDNLYPEIAAAILSEKDRLVTDVTDLNFITNASVDSLDLANVSDVMQEVSENVINEDNVLDGDEGGDIGGNGDNTAEVE